MLIVSSRFQNFENKLTVAPVSLFHILFCNSKSVCYFYVLKNLLIADKKIQSFEYVCEANFFSGTRTWMSELGKARHGSLYFPTRPLRNTHFFASHTCQ